MLPLPEPTKQLAHLTSIAPGVPRVCSPDASLDVPANWGAWVPYWRDKGLAAILLAILPVPSGNHLCILFQPLDIVFPRGYVSL
jgi:hypothetical protein